MVSSAVDEINFSVHSLCMSTSQPDHSKQSTGSSYISVLFPVFSVILLLSITANVVLFSHTFLRSSNVITPEFGSTSKQDVLSTIQRYSLHPLPSDQDVYQAEIKGLVSSLNDPYSEFLPASEADDFRDSLNERYEGIGVRFEFTRGEVIVTQVISGGPAERAGVEVGDVFYQIEDTLVDDLPDDQIAERVRGQKGTTVNITFQRDGVQVPLTIVRDEIQAPLIELDIVDTTAIISISSFGEGLDAKMMQVSEEIAANSQVEEIVIDVRGNTGGILGETVDVLSYFVPERTLLMYEETADGREDVFSTAKDTDLLDFPMTVLVNASSASASEILAGALYDQDDARVIGQPTFGKGVVQQIFPLQNGDQLKLTIAQWFLPSGTDISDGGLQPDTQLKLSEDARQWALQNPRVE